MQSSSKKPPIIWTNLLVLGLPVLITFTVVPWYGFTYGYDLFEWVWLFILITFCEMSITAGYHRLWSHKAYQAHPILKFVFALGGACALQNHCIVWASDHRRHHLYVDDNDKDPYSAKLGFWYSHFGWMIREYESVKDDFSNVDDLFKEPILVWQKKYYLPLTLLMNLGLPLLLGYLHGDIWGALLLLGFLRLVLSQHFTYLINSAAHIWGSRQYDPNQTARDNSFIALLTYGEGYHNYHHTFAWDYRNGIKWYHYDPTKWFIKACSWLKLTSNLRACSSWRQEITRVEVQYQSALAKCEKLIDPALWRKQLESEYQSLLQTLNHWAELKQQWYERKSKTLQDKFQELDAAHIQQAYNELKISLKNQRKNWNALLQDFSALPALAQPQGN
ncbi:MAG: acyl-CoA desaturase [SAR86 cluster bacterium]|uniref:Acyl-CoA desaturase n=1 Tax=SAR86 cluster bacterium TaxID=2030880 RepID=A0A2A5CAM3_9GAMM|nr:MAG: acyl-CoA desaturase [SAR86 cluster bacterium]